MKKSLIALAALATVATAAQAQSSVTLYGIVDMGIMSSKTDGAGNVLAAQSGALSTSRWGVRGTEDLGGGLTAAFNLESEIAADAGTAGGIGILVDGHIQSFFPCFDDERQGFFGTPPVGLAAHFEMGDLHGDIGLPADIDGFIDGLHDVVLLVSDMRGIYTIVSGCRFGQAGHFLSGTVHPRQVDQSCGKAHSAILHGLRDQLFHFLLIGGGGFAVFQSHHQTADVIVSDQRGHIDRCFDAVDVMEELFQVVSGTSAISRDHGGDAVFARVGAGRVPEQHQRRLSQMLRQADRGAIKVRQREVRSLAAREPGGRRGGLLLLECIDQRPDRRVAGGRARGNASIGVDENGAGRAEDRTEDGDADESGDP